MKGKRAKSIENGQTIRDRIESIKREKNIESKIVQLCGTVDSALPKIVEKTGKTSKTKLSSFAKSIGFATLPFLGVGLWGSLGPTGLLAGAIAGSGTWRILSALQTGGIIPANLEKSLKRLFETRNKILHEVGDGQTLSKKEISEIVSDVEKVFEWAYDKGLIDPNAPLESLQKSKGHSPEHDNDSKWLSNNSRRALAKTLSILGIEDEISDTAEKNRKNPKSIVSGTALRAGRAESPDELLSRKKKNVELLKNLLQKRLPKSTKKKLVERLKKTYGYRGPDDLILCEYCLEEDPLKLLQREFRFDDLESIAEDFGCGLSNTSDQKELARAILNHLGFTLPVTPYGIEATLKRVTGYEREFNRAHTKKQIIGLVPHANNELERILHGLIVFYGTVFFGVEHQKAFGKWSADFGRKRQTLGTKFNILKKLENEVLNDPKRIIKLKELFAGREYVVGKKELQDCSDVVVFRAGLSHFRDEIDAMPFAKAKEWARPFFTKASFFIQHIEKNNIYPVTVVVAGKYEDAYGRKWIECTTDTGQTEKIYTNDPMEISRMYFMLPRTNPVRIYPILVEYKEAQ
jgi:hypothetical protein